MIEKISQHTLTPERPAAVESNFSGSGVRQTDPGMNDRIRRLRKLSVEIEPSLSIERALHETAFYQENFGKMSIPVLRASNFLDHCTRKAIYI